MMHLFLPRSGGGSWGLEALLSPEARVLLAAITAFILMMVFGRLFINWLRARRVLEHTLRGDAEHLDLLHARKGNTPTLGGIVLFGAAIASTLTWARLEERAVLLLIAAAVSLGMIGLLDDWKKLKTKRGLSARAKFRAQVMISLVAGVYLYAWPLETSGPVAAGEAATRLFFPFAGGASVQLGLLFVPLVSLVMTGAANAVNLTDGLDGLAAGCSVLIAAAFVGVGLACGYEGSSQLLGVPHLPAGPEAAVFLAALAGAGLGFLWFNCHPAEIFMGDTGALPLGGSLGLAAVLVKQEILLVLVGGVLVAEAASVILQVLSFKIRKRRIFLCSPLHHHFEYKGWPETRITVRFWIVGAALALSSLALLGG